MRIRIISMFAVLAFAGVASAQPTVRDHRAEVKASVSLYPTEAPPAPKEERFVPRRGQVWVAGQYEWRAGTWVRTPASGASSAW